MPTVSEHQTFIQDILHVVNNLEDISHFSRMALNRELVEDVDKLWSSNSSQSESKSSSFSSCSSSSELEGFMSVDGADTDEEHTIIMGMTASLLQVITEMHILNWI